MPANNFPIQYLSHTAIDKQRWNDSINRATNGLVYAQAEYLDSMSPGWDALMADNYRLIMPLLWKKKWGVKYLYQPFGIAQGGLFFSDNCSLETEQYFLQKAMQHFSYGRLDLNEASQLKELKGAVISWRDNYVLTLSEPYEKLSSNYNKDAKKNLRKARAFPQQIATDVTIEDVVRMYKTQYGVLNNRDAADYEKLASIVKKYLLESKAFCIGIKEENELLASAVFLKDEHRIYYVLGAPSIKGKTYKSTHVLIDNVIKKYSESNYKLDFEGSDIPTVATFYQKFAPEKKQYPHVHFNRLPFLFRWLNP